MSTKFSFTLNSEGFVRSVRSVQNGHFAAIRSSLKSVADDIMQDSRDNYCPVDKGDLQATGRVEENSSNGHASVQLLYGSAEVGYAVPVHEGHRLVAWGNETNIYIPPTKFLELPMLAHCGSGGPGWQQIADDFYGYSASAWKA